ncbi:DUF4307 domain-containing protein [Cellulomonas sp. zg-ZUI222]|uniref:DUF4307 domain-containing protein n=1 Tax=Cellulomonas wangleii TaxID=2816956 RepID=A0ABX8D9V0_9CELL|nr:DUF4307 domain-containing protein [Cellulomonas wangleii]MBO0922253.1 DUF4307 domain-containing protein [Cellulomonas wangleii]MBO0925948.1 DUF4307 domain-containing protein [Cellulomonas wangleii]QVI63251.1 DUF4307 domain-containing protein [Cellulomonas wangleii]
MVAPAPRPPVGRYGPEPTDATRRLQRVALAALVVGAMLLLGWIGSGVLRDPVQWQDVGYRVDGPGSTEITFDVTTAVGTGATCRVQALAASYAQVGVLDVDVPPAETRTRRVTVTVPTVELAVTGVVQGCEPVD